MQEFDLIQRLVQRLHATRTDTRFGIGDDAAVIAPPPGYEVVVTTDTLVAGRHFPCDVGAGDIGFKTLAVSLSDVSAMGAEPAWATLTLTVPELEADWCNAFIDGALQAIGPHQVDIVGGDTTRGPLSITGTVFGLVPVGRAVMRHGARPGDVICVTGTLGDAALGLRLWQQREAASRPAATADVDWLYRRLHRPQWRSGVALAGAVHAAVDISDGVLADLSHIAAASDCGARLYADALPVSAAFESLCPAAERRRLQLAGGDDYELCVTLPPAAVTTLAAQLDCPLTAVGEVEAQPGVRVVAADGSRLSVNDFPGWDHFR